MCKSASFVLTKTQCFWDSNGDSHSIIISNNGLHEDGAHGPNVLRCEIIPPDNRYDLPIDQWVYCVNQDILPTWYDAEDCERRARTELPNWYAAHVIRDGQAGVCRYEWTRIVLNGGTCDQSSGYCYVYKGGANNQSGGYCRVYDGGVNNQSGGDCYVADGGVSNQYGGYCYVYDGGVNNQSGGHCYVADGGVSNQYGGYCYVYDGGVNNQSEGHCYVADGGVSNQYGGYCYVVDGGVNNQSGGDCRVYDGGKLNKINHKE